MSDNPDRILQTYMETLLRLQRDRQRDSLTQEELRQIALDAGLSESDLAFVHERVVDFLNRGQGFLKYENWDGAIAELEQAIALEPSNTVALNALAAAHWSRSGGEAGEDIEKARGYATRVLKIDSTNDPALRLMSAIQKGERPSKSKSQPPGKAGRGVVLAVMLVAFGVLVALALRMISSGDDDDPRADTVAHAPTPQAAAEPPKPPVARTEADTGIARLVRSFGEEGIGPGMMEDARSIALDGLGKLYVAEYSGGRIQAFDTTGRYLNQWNVGPKELVHALAADRNGTVYAVHSGQIMRYEGATGTSLGPVKHSGGSKFSDVTLAADGSLVAAWDGHRNAGLIVNAKSMDDIVIFDPKGKVKKTINGAISSATDEFEMEMELATDGLGAIYALGMMNKSVFKFSPEGKFLTRLVSGGDKRGQVQSPDEIAVDGQGRLYVCDFSGVKIFDKDGLYLGVIDVPGAASGVAVDDRNGIFVVARTKVYHYTLRNK